jgi:hypothetical protein
VTSPNAGHRFGFRPICCGSDRHRVSDRGRGTVAVPAVPASPGRRPSPGRPPERRAANGPGRCYRRSSGGVHHPGQRRSVMELDGTPYWVGANGASSRTMKGTPMSERRSGPRRPW